MNEVERACREHCDFDLSAYDNYGNSLRRMELPKTVPPEFRGMPFTSMRPAFMSEFGFVLLSQAFIDDLVNKVIKGGRVLEIMSGPGLLARHLRDAGVDLMATDNFWWYDNHKRMCWELFSYVERLDALKAIRKYGSKVDFVLMSWPEYDSPLAAMCVEEIRKVNPDLKLIYIGEGGGGCCANDEFFDMLSYSCVDIHFDSWFGIQDYVSVFDI